jgi:hypothetical protein
MNYINSIDSAVKVPEILSSMPPALRIKLYTLYIKKTEDDRFFTKAMQLVDLTPDTDIVCRVYFFT